MEYPLRHRLASLFNPRSVAIVGASEKSPWTVAMRHCLQAYGFDGKVHAVNRSGASVFGWPTFTSCAAIKDPVDAAYICVPPESVVETIEDLGRAGIRAAILLTSGYGETGANGASMQEEIAGRATALGIHLLGPNCLGFANIGRQTALTAVAPRGPLLPRGCVSLVCQSGATAAEIVEFAQQQGIALNFFATTGNEAQIAIADVVDYLVDDPDTRVIMVFAETLRHPERFNSAAARAFAARKPIIVLKVGASEVAAHVAKAHTGSLVGDDRAFTAACRKLNLIRVTALEDLVITASLLAHTGPLPAGGAGIASISGGACTLIADRAEESGLPLPAFEPATVRKLRDVLPGYAATLNPLDITGAAVRDPTLFEKAMAILAEDPGIAIRLCLLNLPHLDGMTTPTPAMFDAVGRGLSAGSSPGLLTVQTLKPVSDVSRRIMMEHSIPGVIGGLDHAVRAVAQAIWWSARVRAAKNTPIAAAPARASTTRFPSTEHATFDYLKQFNIPTIPSELTKTADQAVLAARRCGGRVVLKIASPDIPHKTDIGAVRLRLKGDTEVSTAWEQIDAATRKAMPRARIDGISISPMREAGIELFVGTTRDPDWGMLIAVGLGGVWVEALQDTAVRLLPVERADVLEMLTSLRAARVLGGFRGAPAADLQALADVVVNIGAAALALGPDVQSLEINPLLVNGSRIEVLDALIVWHDPTPTADP